MFRGASAQNITVSEDNKFSETALADYTKITEHDVSGNRTVHVDFKGQVTNYQYDVLNRETHREYLSTGRTVDTVYTVTSQVAMLTVVLQATPTMLATGSIELVIRRVKLLSTATMQQVIELSQSLKTARQITASML